MAQIVLVSSRRQALVGDAHLEGAVLPQQIVGNALEDDHVVGSIARADAAASSPKATSITQWWAFSMLQMPANGLQLEPGLGRQTEMKMRMSVVTRQPHALGTGV